MYRYSYQRFSARHIPEYIIMIIVRMNESLLHYWPRGPGALQICAG